MRLHSAFIFLLSCVGCHTTEGELQSPIPERTNLTDTPRSVNSPKNTHVDSARKEPASDDALLSAATCVEKGDTASAVEHLRNHLKKHPDQVMIRAYLAELLFKLERWADAQFQFDEFVASAQNCDGAPYQNILHCHTRLMEIAQRRDDSYGEHLHRGIGFVLLARQLEAASADDVEKGFRERLLCKASVELACAKKLHPDEPRPMWYLAEVWTKLNQPRSAERALKQAKALAALQPLPPCEQRALALAIPDHGAR